MANVTLPNGWTAGASAPLGLFEAMGASVGGKLYVFAGFYNSYIKVTSRAEVYDPATNSWARLSSVPMPQSHVGTANDGRTIYFAGGFRGDWFGKASNEFWMYDTVTGKWKAGPSLPGARAPAAWC